jgi:hypothetical protein
LHKSDRVEVRDPELGVIVQFFNPRADRWHEHFRWEGYQLLGQSPVGRAAVRILELNHPRRLRFRAAEELFGLFPPISEES